MDDPELTDQERERVLGELRDLGERTDPVPEAVLDAARAALDWRRADAELAELVAEGGPVAVRGHGEGPGVRLLTFRAGEVEIELEVAASGERRHVTGQVVPGQATTVEALHAFGLARAQADQLGRFALPDLPSGPARLRLRLGGRLVQTAPTVL
jgi:hypothetical protein